MTLQIFWAWLSLASILFVSSLVHEDAAILAGGYMAIQQHLPVSVAATTLFCGVVCGDLLIYGLGRLARNNERIAGWVGRFSGTALSGQSGTAPSWLSKRLLWVVVGCRLTPALLFPTFAAIGWNRVPFRRFCWAVLLSACLYVPPMFLAVVYFGDALVDHLKFWGWPLLLLAVGSVWLLRNRLGAARQADLPLTDQPEIRVHAGMPPLSPQDVRVPLSEKINPILFYVPLFFQWMGLGLRYRSLTLPTAANPSIEAGGLLGESKIACMDLIGPEAKQWAAPSAAIDTLPGDIAETRRRLLAAMDRNGVSFPAVVKPDIGWRGIGVRRLNNADEIDAYLTDFPLGNRLMIQNYVPFDGEAGVFYARLPGQEKGEIFSMTFRYYPFVLGDGEHTLRQLILGNERTRWKADLHLKAHADEADRVLAKGESLRLSTVGSSRVGGLYTDSRAYVTPALTDRFDQIAKSIPEFWFGRFDVRFADIERFQAGEDFQIVEVNGAGAEAIHMWDPNFPLGEAYRALFDQQARMFAIADANRKRGFAPMTVMQLVRCQQRQQRLLKAYPDSN